MPVDNPLLKFTVMAPRFKNGPERAHLESTTKTGGWKPPLRSAAVPAASSWGFRAPLSRAPPATNGGTIKIRPTKAGSAADSQGEWRFFSSELGQKSLNMVIWHLQSAISIFRRGFSILPGVLVFAGTLSVLSAETTLYVDKYFEVRDHEQPVKYVFNGDTRVARVTGSLSTNSRIQRLRLSPGWNLISLAVAATNAVRQMTNSQFSILSSQSVFRWDSSAVNWLPVPPDETLPAGTILWLHAATNATIALTGSYTDPTNWSVPPSGSFQPGAGLEALSLPGPSANVALWHYDATSQSWQVQAPAVPGSDPGFPEFLSPGDAIFMNPVAPVELNIPEAAWRIRYYHQDHLGSSAVITDDAGALVEETAFYPFGTPRNEHRLRQIQESYTFTQKERDRESDLHYFGRRFYHSTLGRWLSTDPKEEKGGGLNLYAYARHNPLKYMDPDGMEVVWSESLKKDKSFQKALKILENTAEGKRILDSLETADVQADKGKLTDKSDHAHATGLAHNRAVISGTKSHKTRAATTVITIDLSKARKLKLTDYDLANVLHHELRHAEIHNTVASGEDYTTDEGINKAEAVRNQAHKELDVYIPGSRVKGRGTGIQTLDPQNIDFQKEIGLLPKDYLEESDKPPATSQK
jgi:RHS repeat-associated protein